MVDPALETPVWSGGQGGWYLKEAKPPGVVGDTDPRQGCYHEEGLAVSSD